MKRLFSLALAMVFIFGSVATVSAYDDISPAEAYAMVKNPTDFMIPGTDEYYPAGTKAYILDVRTQAEWYWVGHPGKETCKSECACNELGCSEGCGECPSPWTLGGDETAELECQFDEDKEKYIGVWLKHRGSFLEGKVIHIPWNLWEYVPQDKKYDRKIPNRFFDEEVVRQFNPGDIIIVMCRSGKRSVSAAEELEDPSHPACKRLEELGFYDIYNMEGGFEGGKDDCGYRTKNNGWKKAGTGSLPYNCSDKGIWTPQQRGRSLAK